MNAVQHEASQRPLRYKGILLLFIVAAVTGAYARFFLDFHLRSAVETIASRANGARVNMGRLETHLLKSQVDLYGLEIANQAAPRKNLLQIDHIRFNFIWNALVRKKLVLNHLSIEGVHYGTSRAVEGTILDDENEGHVNLLDRVASGIYTEMRNRLNDNPLKTLGSLLTGASIHTSLYDMHSKLSSIRRIKELKRKLDDNFHSWGLIQAQLPTARELADLGKALDANGRGRGLASTSESARDIKARLGEKLKLAENGLARINDEARAFSKDLGSVDKFLDEDVSTLRGQLKLPDLNNPDLSNQLFGPKLLNYLERISYWVDLTRRYMPRGDRQNLLDIHSASSGNGVDVHYGKMAAYPGFLLFEGAVTSDTSADPTKGLINGKLFGITTDPPIFGRPMEIAGQATFPGLGMEGMNVDFKVDHTGDVYEESLLCSAESFPIENWTLIESGDLNLGLSRGKAQIQFSADFKDAELHAKLNASFWNIEYNVTSRYQRIEDTVKTAVNASAAFELNADISGPIEKLQLNTSSHLGEKLAWEIQSEFKHQVGAIEDDIRKNILDLIFPEKEELASKFKRLTESSLSATQDGIRKLQELDKKASQQLAKLDRTPASGHSPSRKTQSTN